MWRSIYHPYSYCTGTHELLKDMGQVDEAQQVLRPEDVDELKKSLGGEHRVLRGAVKTIEEINQAFVQPAPSLRPSPAPLACAPLVLYRFNPAEPF